MNAQSMFTHLHCRNCLKEKLKKKEKNRYSVTHAFTLQCRLEQSFHNNTYFMQLSKDAQRSKENVRSVNVGENGTVGP